MSGTKCIRLAFEFSKAEGFMPIQTEARVDGVEMILEDLETFQQYYITIKPHVEEKNVSEQICP